MLCFHTFLPSQTLHLLPDVPVAELSNRQVKQYLKQDYSELLNHAKLL